MILDNLPVRLVLADDKNSTFIGIIHIVPAGAPPEELTTVNSTGPVYDYNGAGMFIILVIVVYALSIVLLIASFIKKKQQIVETVDEKTTVHQYLMQMQDRKDRTARDNFKKLKMRVIDDIARSDSRRGTITSIEGYETIQSRFCDVQNRLSIKEQGVTGALLGAGIHLYRPLLAIRDLQNSKTPSESEDSNKLSVGDHSPGRVSFADASPSPTRVTFADERDTHSREKSATPSPASKQKQVRINSKPEILYKAPEPQKGCIRPCSSPSPSAKWDTHQPAPLKPEESPQWPERLEPETTALLAVRVPQDGDRPEVFCLDIWVPQLPENSPRLQPKATRINVRTEDSWTPKKGTISSV